MFSVEAIVFHERADGRGDYRRRGTIEPHRRAEPNGVVLLRSMVRGWISRTLAGSLRWGDTTASGREEPAALTGPSRRADV